MEKILTLFFVLSFVFCFLMSIRCEYCKKYNEKTRLMWTVLSTFFLLTSIVYPLTMIGFGKLFAVVSISVFFLLLFNENLIRKKFFT